MNNLLNLCTYLIKDAGSTNAENTRNPRDQQDGVFPFVLRSIHEALASVTIVMEDAKISNKDVHIIYADF
jgi:hypothetical protein